MRLRSYRPNLDVLEDRCLLAAPVIDPIQVPLNIPAGKTLIVPVTASDPGGGTVNISLAPAAGTSGITITPHTGDTFLQVNVGGFGTMEFELFNDLAPRTVDYLTGLVDSGFYNGVTFHRVVPNFVIQGGDPTGTGSGGPPGATATQTQLKQLQFPDEFDPTAMFSGTGQLAMANSGNDTNGSQFFVTLGTERFLDFNHTIFGQLVRGFDVMKAIDAVPTDANNKPLTPVVITSAQIVQDPNAAVFTVTNTNKTTGSVSLTVTATSSTTPSSPTTETLTGQVIADTTNDPPILNVSQAPLNFGQAPSSNPVKNLVTAVNAPVNITLSSTDLEGNTPTYSVTVATADAANATVTQSTTTPGQFTITPNTGFTGLIHLQASVTESGSARNNGPDSQAFTLSVGDQPITATAAAGFNATAGTSTTQTLTTFTDADTTSLPADFQVSINWGDGTALDTTSAAVSGSNGSYTVKGTHTYAHGGTYDPQVTVTDIHTSATGGDKGGAATQATTTATVTGAAAPAVTLTAGQAVPVTGTAGTALTAVPVATFNDTATGAQASNYTVTISWDDGTAVDSTTGTVVSLGGGKFQVLGSHTYLSSGTFNPSVTITSTNAASSPSTISVDTTATISTGTLPPTPSPVATNQAYVNQLFLDLTGNPPTAQQLSTFTGQLNSGKSHSDVAKEILALPAYKTEQVQLVYQNMFGKAATSQQMSSGLQVLNSTGKVSALRVRLLSSDAFFTSVGGGTATGYLNALGHEVLHGSIDATTLSKLSQELSNGASRLTVLQDLVKADLQQVEQVGVTNVYEQYLHRAPTAAELSAGAALIGKSEEVKLIQSLVSSTEYFNKTTGTTTVTSSASTSSFGQRVTFTATVGSAASGASVPTGTVTFEDVTSGATLGTATLDATGKASFSTNGLSVGTHTIRAIYGGDKNFPASTGTLTQTVNQAGTTTALTSSSNPASSTASITFTAKVAATSPGTGTPTGTVTFTDTTTGVTLGTAVLNANGTATFTVTGLQTGTQNITATYAGTTNYTSSSGSVSQVVST